MQMKLRARCFDVFFLMCVCEVHLQWFQTKVLLNEPEMDNPQLATVYSEKADNLTLMTDGSCLI